MQRWSSFACSATLLLPLASALPAADFCAAKDLFGAYGFQLAGTTTISGPETPVAVVGRSVFDAASAISGYSSVNFNGLFLGNPITGAYELHNDCSITFSLQDTSGAYQHFTGRMQPAGNRIDFSQSDPGTGGRGRLERIPESCDAGTFRGHYRLEGDAFDGSADADGAGNLTLNRPSGPTAGSYTVESDCFVELRVALANGADATIVNLRGILVANGSVLLAIQTDPERVSSLTLTKTPNAPAPAAAPIPPLP